MTMLKLISVHQNNKEWGNTTNWKNTLFRKINDQSRKLEYLEYLELLKIKNRKNNSKEI